MGRHRLKIPAAIIALAMTACLAGKEKGRAMSSIPETEYWSTAADEGLPLSLTLSPTGEAKLWIRSNRDNPKRGALGYFEASLPSQRVSEAQASVAAPEFAAAANPASVVPGEVVRKITVKQPGVPDLVRFVGEEGAAPAGFLKAESAFLKAVEEAGKSPSLAIGFSLEKLPGEIVSGEELRFDLLVANPGRQALAFATPKTWADSGTEMTAKGIRSDIPLAQLNNSHAPSVAVGPGYIGLDASAASKGTLPIGPGQSLRLPVRLRLPWEPGTYDFQVVFRASLSDAQGKAHTHYEWVSPKSRLEVKKR
jgi:hypothetical protein